LLSPHNELVEVYPESLDYYGRLGLLAKANINLNLRKVVNFSFRVIAEITFVILMRN